MVRPFLLEVYADDRCYDVYAVYANYLEEESDLLEDAISNNEELWSYLFDIHVDDWGDEFDDQEEFLSMIAPHITGFSNDIWKDGKWIDEEYQQWFESLEVVLDERD